MESNARTLYTAIELSQVRMSLCLFLKKSHCKLVNKSNMFRIFSFEKTKSNRCNII